MNNKRFIQLKKASFVCVCVCVCVGGGVGGVVLSYRKQGKFINLNKLKKKKKKNPTDCFTNIQSTQESHVAWWLEIFQKHPISLTQLAIFALSCFSFGLY